MPSEDTGTLFCTISMPPATSVARTRQIIDEVDKILAADPAIQSREQIQGYNFIAGSGSDQATFIIKLKPFKDRQKSLWWKSEFIPDLTRKKWISSLEMMVISGSSCAYEPQ